jgi:hypothetical protein
MLWVPMDNITQNAIVQRTSSWRMALSIFRSAGLPGFYRGFCATYVVWAPISGVFFAVYEILRFDKEKPKQQNQLCLGVKKLPFTEKLKASGSRTVSYGTQ